MDRSFEVLNTILQGEHMAIEQYQACIDTLSDGPLRNHLTSILTDHKNHATRLAYHIQTNGGHVREGAGVIGKIENWKQRILNLGKENPEAMLDRLYNGEDKGLARAVQYSERNLSIAEKELLEPIFADEHDHLKQLQKIKEGLYFH
ncbi:protein of unknown function (DUF2383) [Desulfosporosinus acidiphilus SJ4]|uniref:DUF2383 domain-containing protein n=1 Tax=Desulfosporosinus acidiphilus (strain DSM 22704 / JCM 16185 / SJ4) TaxID=646529 RepID=I4D8A9_DESAJ|nr:DUF2383 domain-containing protein [Desulfosporosinus acidiphilus]AFM42033.1 protein of unknown function (DUF2383) [Desulfosporosinus acidiphilus SJ4]